MKKLLFFLLIVSGVAQAQIFLCNPRPFSSPKIPGGYNVVGISAKALSYTLGDTSALPCYFQFYRIKDGEMQVVDDQNDNIPAKVTIGPTTYYLHQMLFSANKQYVYGAAQIFAGAQGYALLPIEEQTYLNALYPE